MPLQSKIRKSPAISLLAIMAISAACSFVYHVIANLPAVGFTRQWDARAVEPQIWIPLISICTISWLPWAVTRLHFSACRQHFAGFALLFAFVGWDLIHRLSHTWYFPDWFGRC